MANLYLSSPRVLYLAMFIGLLSLEAATERFVVSAGFDYRAALDKSLLFFEAQRSGKLPTDQRVKWRGDSALRDGFSQGVDLVGGYYDAGDHVKFGLPMAFTVTMLSWSAIDFNKDITAAYQLGNTLKAIKWGTDYFLKAHTRPNALWGQVGDGASDHYCWERAENMKTPRTAYKLDPRNPGSDLAGETAAALAAASLAFDRYNSSYSDTLLRHAQQLFDFADTYRDLYTDSIQGAKDYYKSSGYEDELLWAAAWLYRASGNEYYLQYVVKNAAFLGGTGWAVREFSWDNKYAGVQILLSQVLLEGKVGEQYTPILKQYKAKADFFACACLQKNNGYNVQLTPGGLIYIRQWNNLQYASSAAFLLAVYSQYLTPTKTGIKCPDSTLKPQDLLDFAKSQADYILGNNPKSMSYLVGYGANYPRHVHHRDASIPHATNAYNSGGCVEGFEMWYNRPQQDPNVIDGALVGGPDKNDEFNDVRSNYEQTEPTISGTAPVVGLFAKLLTSSGSSGYAGGSYKHETTAVARAAPYSGASKSDRDAVKFVHSITTTWTAKGETYYRHKVVVKNVGMSTIVNLKLKIDDLTGPIYGLIKTNYKNIYEAPPMNLKPGSEFVFVYIQGGPQARVSVSSYN